LPLNCYDYSSNAASVRPATGARSRYPSPLPAASSVLLTLLVQLPRVDTPTQIPETPPSCRLEMSAPTVSFQSLFNFIFVLPRSVSLGLLQGSALLSTLRLL